MYACLLHVSDWLRYTVNVCCTYIYDELDRWQELLYLSTILVRLCWYIIVEEPCYTPYITQYYTYSHNKYKLPTVAVPKHPSIEQGSATKTAIIAVSPEPEKYRVTVTKLTTSPSCETPAYRVYSVSQVQVGYLHLHLQLQLTWLCWQCDQIAFTSFLPAFLCELFIDTCQIQVGCIHTYIHSMHLQSVNIRYRGNEWQTEMRGTVSL